jgi:hypothetical protein
VNYVSIADRRHGVKAFVLAGPFALLDTAWTYADLVARCDPNRVPVMINAGGEEIWRAPVNDGAFVRAEIIDSLLSLGREMGLEADLCLAMRDVSERTITAKENFCDGIRLSVLSGWRRAVQWAAEWSPLGWFL